MKRNFGLDLVRSIAIGMVLVSHGKLFFMPLFTNKAPWLGLSVFGLYGVELFFVLSGFLIGQILLRDIAPQPSPGNIFFFYIRRWFRTLPSYYLVLLALLLLEYWQGTSGVWHWQHFFFWQNFSPGGLAFFPVSWSLVIEEWFYLLTPLLLLGSSRCFPKISISAKTLGLLLFFLAAISCARLGYVNFFNPSWDDGVRKCVPLRFDALYFGVLMAWLKLHKPAWFRYLSSQKIFCCAVGGLAGVGTFFFHAFGVQGLLDSSFFARTWSFSLVSLCCALTLPFCEQNNWLNQRLAQLPFFAALITRLSLYSYVIYLIHLDIFFALLPVDIASLLRSSSLFLLALFLTFFFSSLLHHGYEQPLMKLRERFK